MNSRSSARLMAGGVLVSTCLVVLLATQARNLRRQVTALQERANSLPPGSFTPLFTTLTLDADTIHLGRSPSAAQIYFVYNTRCPYCELSIPAWKGITSRLSVVPGVRVLGISLDSAAASLEYAERHSLSYQNAVLLDERTKDLYRFRAVPQTIVIDSSGRVVFSRLGVMEMGPASDSAVHAIVSLVQQNAANEEAESYGVRKPDASGTRSVY